MAESRWWRGISAQLDTKTINSGRFTLNICWAMHGGKKGVWPIQATKLGLIQAPNSEAAFFSRLPAALCLQCLLALRRLNPVPMVFPWDQGVAASLLGPIAAIDVHVPAAFVPKLFPHLLLHLSTSGMFETRRGGGTDVGVNAISFDRNISKQKPDR